MWQEARPLHWGVWPGEGLKLSPSFHRGGTGNEVILTAWRGDRENPEFRSVSEIFARRYIYIYMTISTFQDSSGNLGCLISLWVTAILKWLFILLDLKHFTKVVIFSPNLLEGFFDLNVKPFLNRSPWVIWSTYFHLLFPGSSINSNGSIFVYCLI